MEYKKQGHTSVECKRQDVNPNKPLLILFYNWHQRTLPYYLSMTHQKCRQIAILVAPSETILELPVLLRTRNGDHRVLCHWRSAKTFTMSVAGCGYLVI